MNAYGLTTALAAAVTVHSAQRGAEESVTDCSALDSRLPQLNLVPDSVASGQGNARTLSPPPPPPPPPRVQPFTCAPGA